MKYILFVNLKLKKKALFFFFFLGGGGIYHGVCVDSYFL